MTKRKLTRLQKSTQIVKTARATQWCYVNTLNEFTFLNQTFVISQEVKEYEVRNKSFETEDYTNEAYMEEILVVLDDSGDLKFYNQNYDLVENGFIAVRL